MKIILLINLILILINIYQFKKLKKHISFFNKKITELCDLDFDYKKKFQYFDSDIKMWREMQRNINKKNIEMKKDIENCIEINKILENKINLINKLMENWPFNKSPALSHNIHLKNIP